MKKNVLLEKLKICVHVVSVWFFKTRFFYRDSWQFWIYWKKCQLKKRSANLLSAASSRRSPAVLESARHFRRHKFCVYRDSHTVAVAERIKSQLSPWFDRQTASGYAVEFSADDPWNVEGVRDLFSGELRALIESILGSNFKIFFGKALRSVPVSAAPADGYNSFMWHADGGPPSCVNIMLYMDDTDQSNGAIEFGPTDVSVRVLAKSVSTWRNVDKSERSRLFAEAMQKNGQAQMATGQAGTVVLFSNNILHRGGLSMGPRSRDVLIFHLYPSLQPFAGQKSGVAKVAPVPKGPDF